MQMQMDLDRRNDAFQHNIGGEFSQFANFQPFLEHQPLDQQQFFKQTSNFNVYNTFGNFHNFAFDHMNADLPTGMDLATNFGMHAGLMGTGMDMNLALGFDHHGFDMPIGLDMVCADQCRFPHDCGHYEQCCEQCCECCEDEVVEFNADYLCPLGFLRVCIIVIYLFYIYFNFKITRTPEYIILSTTSKTDSPRRWKHMCMGGPMGCWSFLLARHKILVN